jgi:hypothetical protein
MLVRVDVQRLHSSSLFDLQVLNYRLVLYFISDFAEHLLLLRPMHGLRLMHFNKPIRQFSS